MSGKRGGLGRNLSALLGSTYAVDAPAPESPEVTKLKLDTLQPGKYQPRTVIDDAPLQELANSIKQQGLLQPIVARALENGRHEIIAGERRWRACQIAGLTDVPVILRQVDDETAMAIALVENLQREDLNPIDQARAMERLIKEFALTHQQIADLLSKSRTAVSNFLRLLSLSGEVMRLLEHGDLDMGHARALLVLDKDKQIMVAKLVVAKNLSVRETEKLVNRVKNEKLPELDTNEIHPHFASVEKHVQTLGQLLNTKVKIKPGKSGKGSLVIHYDSIHSLESVIQQIIG
ncbi:MAG: ParB/RepB/Spo0J family partition protein [Legionella sp.]|nr:ParB/RepB/Spo0J family partition protein [Legionella sp.]